mmetsp:Transcript_122980/g.281972  ORF Transcript_122980/g.281972 Transcript_122980/m.281972 type:complete len:781 (+) Transcript_122980:66-2408(+)
MPTRLDPRAVDLLDNTGKWKQDLRKFVGDGGAPKRSAIAAKLQFLDAPFSTVDFSSAEVRKQGFVSKSPVELEEDRQPLTPHRSRQKLVLRVLNHKLVETFIFLVILFDIAYAAASSSDEETTIDIVESLAVNAIMLIENLARLYGLGPCKFFRNPICVLEFIIVTVSVAADSIMAVESMTHLRQLRTIRGLLRIGRGARACVSMYNRRQKLKKYLRHRVSMNKQRYVDEEFDLDLVYVRPRFIAMSLPAFSKEATYRNPFYQVATFFNHRHPNHYLICNCCNEREYPIHAFFYRVIRYPFFDHSIPTLRMMWDFCMTVETFLDAHPENVFAVHCKGGKGRTGTMTCAWLLYCKVYSRAQDALASFEARRTDPRKPGPRQGVETSSQVRFVRYFERCVKVLGGYPSNPQPIFLKRITICGFHSAPNLAWVCGRGYKTVVLTKEFQNGPVGGRQFNDEDLVQGGKQAKDLEAAARGMDQVDDEDILKDELAEGVDDAGTARLLFSTRDPDVAMDRSRAALPFSCEADDRYPGTPPLTPLLEWEFNGVELCGEVKFEIHTDDPNFMTVQYGMNGQAHNRPSIDPDAEDEDGQEPAFLQASKKTTTGLQSTRTTTRSKTMDLSRINSRPATGIRDRLRRRDHSLKLSFWMHTAFPHLTGRLVHGSPPVITADGRHIITVALNQYDFDVASGAPKLVEYGHALEMQVEFHVPVEVVADRKPARSSKATEADGSEVHQDSAAGEQLWNSWGKGSPSDLGEATADGWPTSSASSEVGEDALQWELP